MKKNYSHENFLLTVSTSSCHDVMCKSLNSIEALLEKTSPWTNQRNRYRVTSQILIKFRFKNWLTISGHQQPIWALLRHCTRNVKVYETFARAIVPSYFIFFSFFHVNHGQHMLFTKREVRIGKTELEGLGCYPRPPQLLSWLVKRRLSFQHCFFPLNSTLLYRCIVFKQCSMWRQ